MNHSLVTVVVPVYKVEKYLDRCVSSIVNQSYTNLEIILVDDGSPDTCPQMCDAWAKKDSRIKVVHKANAGLGMARNTGIENAAGEYICFFDSDDYIALDTIEKALALAKETCAEVVVFGMSSVDQSGQVRSQDSPISPQKCYVGEEITNTFLPDLIDSRHNGTIIKNLCLSACSCLFSMELVKRTNWRFLSERENISEDSYAIIWLFQYVSKVAVLEEALYYYCENASSLTHTYREDRYQRILRFYKDCCAMADKAGFDQTVKTRIGGLFLSFSIAAMKQIAAARIDTQKHWMLLTQITKDETIQDVLRHTYLWNTNAARKVLFFAIRNRLHIVVYLLTKLQAAKDKIGK